MRFGPVLHVALIGLVIEVLLFAGMAAAMAFVAGMGLQFTVSAKSAIVVQAMALFFFPFGSLAGEASGLAVMRASASGPRGHVGRLVGGVLSAGLVLVTGQLWALPVSVSGWLFIPEATQLIQDIGEIAAAAAPRTLTLNSALNAITAFVQDTIQLDFASVAAPMAFLLWWLFWSAVFLPILWTGLSVSFSRRGSLTRVLNPYSHWAMAVLAERRYAKLIRDSLVRMLSGFPLILVLGAAIWLFQWTPLVALISTQAVALVIGVAYFAGLTSSRLGDLKSTALVERTLSDRESGYVRRATGIASAFVFGSGLVLAILVNALAT